MSGSRVSLAEPLNRGPGSWPKVQENYYTESEVEGNISLPLVSQSGSHKRLEQQGKQAAVPSGKLASSSPQCPAPQSVPDGVSLPCLWCRPLVGTCRVHLVSALRTNILQQQQWEETQSCPAAA